MFFISLDYLIGALIAISLPILIFAGKPNNVRSNSGVTCDKAEDSTSVKRCYQADGTEIDVQGGGLAKLSCRDDVAAEPLDTIEVKIGQEQKKAPQDPQPTDQNDDENNTNTETDDTEDEGTTTQSQPPPTQTVGKLKHRLRFARRDASPVAPHPLAEAPPPKRRSLHSRKIRVVSRDDKTKNATTTCSSDTSGTEDEGANNSTTRSTTQRSTLASTPSATTTITATLSSPVALRT
ncbi:hypothetical protein BDZ91DRAFT_789959 [Kalaharituber pfeilii]|nr:hypothetical protein BDZ91DRAFT_789959 [Kalaharituber pfeilii]